MRTFINIVESLNSVDIPAKLYHGSSPENRSSILKYGILKDKDSSWKHFGEGVYLADDISVAKSYGNDVYEVLVSNLNINWLVPDDHELYDYFDGVLGER